ncbi:hypothetical protein D8M05_15975 [Oceanobacillus bengalensis]|uniref:Uncharacterized protein n=1 Tax=Oceanobacillus bengalensis TaxID=1435466 RepID=A0A494YTK9_9BACI|nr:hypothetical protein D8M05_15975 [Oceanobacillus bengalensis]
MDGCGELGIAYGEGGGGSSILVEKSRKASVKSSALVEKSRKVSVKSSILVEKSRKVSVKSSILVGEIAQGELEIERTRG